jgi:hypothetical protein
VNPLNALHPLTFELPDGSTRTVRVTQLLNAGYAALGVPAPATTPALYPVSPYLAQQTSRVDVQHGRTSGEAEWALVVAGDGELLLTAACDHTDRDLEVHGVAWSKNASPDVLASRAWPLEEVASRTDTLTLRAWVTHDGEETEIQNGTCGDLLTPGYWAALLRERGDLLPGTVLISGTIPMAEGVDQFAGHWRVELGDPATGRTIGLAYDVVRMAEPIG